MSETTCPGNHVINWWSDKCYVCGHLLATHRDANAERLAHPTPEEQAVWDAANPYVALGNCSLCSMHNELTASIAAQNAALRTYAERMRSEAKDFATNLQTTAKTYVDDKDALVRKEMPTWVNNRFVAVVKPEALKVDPRI